MLKRLYYSHPDRVVTALLVVLIVSSVVVTSYVGGFFGSAQSSSAADSLAADNPQQAFEQRSRGPSANDNGPSDERYSAGQPYSADAAPRTITPFAFDPNTADSATLLRLGLERYVVRNILAYRRAGGVFRRPLDLARTYGLSLGDYRQLEPFIRIDPRFRPASTLLSEQRQRRDSLPRRVKLKPGEHVAVNCSDTSALMQVPGIGRYFASQILRYRSRLGGYVSPSQLVEIEGFPQEAIAYFADDTLSPRRMDVNDLSFSALRRHPYMSYRLAHAIIDHRRLHGRLTDIAPLAHNAGLTDEQIERLKPYIEY